ncbi:MAG: hypothetical protein U1B30_10795 [Pseudomonadota bacterium]|nr:hypothetical protein [Pseudomonadota bacterium]
MSKPSKKNSTDQLKLRRPGIDLQGRKKEPATLDSLIYEIKKSEPLYRVYAEFKSDFSFAQRLTNEHGSGYTVGRAEQLPKSYVEF